MITLENYWEYIIVAVVVLGVFLSLITIIKMLRFDVGEMMCSGESFKKPSFLKSLIVAFVAGLAGELSLISNTPGVVFELIYRFVRDYNLLGYDLLISDFFIIRFVFSFIPALIGSLAYSLFYYFKNHEGIRINIFSFILIHLGTILISALLASILVIIIFANPILL